MNVILKQTDYDAIVAHALAALPNEACGLIGGRMDGGAKIVEKVYLLENPDQSPEHFSIDPKAQLSAIKDMRALGITLLGNFHSHPASPARPSDEDIRLALSAKDSYLILSLAEETPELKAFEIAGGKPAQQQLEIIAPDIDNTLLNGKNDDGPSSIFRTES